MMKNSVFIKTFACLFTTSLVVGAFTYSSERFVPRKVDFSAFKNASANIQYISSKPDLKEAVVVADVTGGIVKSIEKEVRRKILKTRVSMAPKKIEVKYEVIAKNWNDIRPEFAAVDLNLDQAAISTLILDEMTSEFEINNKELIKLYSFETETFSYATFSDVAISSYEEVNDEVSVAQASTATKIIEEITPLEIVNTPTEAVATESKEDLEAAKVATTENPVNDDLVVYDYSDESEKTVATEPKIKKMFDSPISNSVREVIEREVHKSNPGALNSQVARRSLVNNKQSASDLDLTKIMESEDTTVYDYSKYKQAGLAKSKDPKSMISAFAAGFAPDTTTQVEFTIKAKEISLSTQKVRPSFGFEFVPDYDRAERMDDQTTGEIKFGYSLAGDASTQTGVVQAQGLIPTRVELSLANKGIEVPLLNEESIQKFLQKKGLDIVGNLFMTAIDSEITDVEIDSDYQAKVFFTNKFKLVDTQENASYVLFLGVKNGNMLVRYLLDNKESAQKIVYVGEGEMYFENPSFVNTERELYTFTTRSLLGRKVKELNINGSDISFFGTSTVAKKKTLNSYEIKVPELVENSRKYLEFKHLGDSLFVGTSDTREIEIPGQDFIGRVLQAHQLSELGERCLVQVNLAKDLRDIKVSGKNRAGEMFAETSFLDNDGNFSRDNSELSEKVFITGDLEGIFNVRLDYTDGSTDFLKSYCSEGSYLIEQL